MRMSFEATIAKTLYLNSPKKCESPSTSSQRLEELEKQSEQQPSTGGGGGSSSETQNCLLRTIKHRPLTYHTLVEQILHTIGELEHTIVQDHQHDYKLHMALVKQRDKVANLRSSLENEKKRNDRLVQLIQGADSGSSTDDETNMFDRVQRVAATAGTSGIGSSDFMSIDAYESISPLLMQQRYDELSISYKQCRRQLVKREKAITRCRCENEKLNAKHDHLIDEYRNLQQRFEELCTKYLRLQSKKYYEIQKLRDALNCASNCVLNAQQLVDVDDYCTDSADSDAALQFKRDFRQNLQSFIKSLRHCEWLQHNSIKKSIK